MALTYVASDSRFCEREAISSSLAFSSLRCTSLSFSSKPTRFCSRSNCRRTTPSALSSSEPSSLSSISILSFVTASLFESPFASFFSPGGSMLQQDFDGQFVQNLLFLLLGHILYLH